MKEQQIHIVLNDKELYEAYVHENYKAIELVSACLFNEIDEDINNIHMNTSLEQQLSEGDFTLIYDNCHKNVEVKKCKQHDGTNKISFDICYLTNDLSNEYIQKTTYHSLGWLYTLQSDYLVCYFNNLEQDIFHKYFYIIYDIQSIKKNLIHEVEKNELRQLRGIELEQKIQELNETLKQKNSYFNYFIANDYDKHGEIAKKTLCISVHVDRLIFNRIDKYEVIVKLE